MPGRIDRRLIELGLELPPTHTPVGTYLPWRISGSILYIAGQGPILKDGSAITGRVGTDLTMAEGQAAAKAVALMLIAQARDGCGGDLDRIVRWVKLLGMVNAPPDFDAHAQVINGASDVIVDVFGEAGRHARVAMGMTSLPVNISVEIDAVIEIQ
jgi:enamine deaminase RidA (YjgF/YER057c/UK114 family)